MTFRDRGEKRRLAVDAAVALAGVLYVAAALVFHLTSPLVGVLSLIAAGLELVHRQKPRT